MLKRQRLRRGQKRFSITKGLEAGRWSCAFLRTAWDHGHRQLRHPHRLGALTRAPVRGPRRPVGGRPGRAPAPVRRRRPLPRPRRARPHAATCRRPTTCCAPPRTIRPDRDAVGHVGAARRVAARTRSTRSGSCASCGADGTWSTLSRDDLADPPPFADGPLPARVRGQRRHAVLPPGARRPRRERPRQPRAPSSGDPLEIWVQTGRVLDRDRRRRSRPRSTPARA